MSVFLTRLAQNPQLKADAIEYAQGRRAAALERMAKAVTTEDMFRAQGAVSEADALIIQLER